jgi:hypothetical protein
MPPPVWTPTYNFATDAAPQNLINAAALQAQLQQLSGYLAEQAEALKVSIRDDNTLTDELVRIRNLHPELAAWLQSAVDGSVATQALDYWYPVKAASTGDVPNLFDTQPIDGVMCTPGDFVLLKDQTDPTQNGLWEVHNAGDPAPNAAGLWVRRGDLPELAPSGKGWAVIVREGTVNGGTAWGLVAGGDPTEQPVVGTDPLAFFPVFALFPVSIAHGGTGATTAAGARTALGCVGTFVGSITGNGVLLDFPVAHNLGTDAVDVSVQDAAGNAIVVDWIATSVNGITVQFAAAPTAAETFSVTVQG